MGALSFNDEFVSPVSPATFFRAAVLDGIDIYPMLLPDLVLSAAVVEGDGGPGTVREYHLSKSAGIYSYMRERHHVMDKENFVDKFTWVEGGDLGTKLVSYASCVKFEPTNNGGCICKYGAEYEPIDGIDYTEEMKGDRDLLKLAYKTVEAYLLTNPAAYV